MNKKTFPLPDIQAPRKAVPGPLGNMELTLPQGVGVLRFSAWKGLEGVNHAFTTRVGGVSENEVAAMNLGFGRGDEPEPVSYTHLDVYKRQHHALAPKALGIDELVHTQADHDEYAAADVNGDVPILSLIHI